MLATTVLRAMLVSLFVASGAASAEAADGRLIDKLTGKPIAGAEITVVGQRGSVKTDADGKFVLSAEFKPPFVVLVILPGGRVAKPITVDAISSPLELAAEAAVNEEVTVAAGAAPSIETSPGQATTMVTARDISMRGAANLMQSVENVPGVSQVSEGQAAVPAVRGLARGRTLILLDGSRVSSERRVGPSATFVDPSVIEGVDVARGPGSVAYGSDAFGGVISVRTKRPGYTGTQLSGGATFGFGIPDQRFDATISHGLGDGGLLFTAHARDAEDYDGPDKEVLNSGYGDAGFLGRFERRYGPGLFSVSWESDFGDDIERPRNNSDAVRFYYPFEDSHRLNVNYDRGGVAGFDLVRFAGFYGSIDQRTDQDRIPTPSRARDIVRADISASDFQFRATGTKLWKGTSLEMGVDVNGRVGLEAHDILIQYDQAGNVVSEIDNLSIDSARRIDTGFFFQGDHPLGARFSVAGGLRFDYVTNVNEGGYFGDQSVDNGAFAGFATLTAKAAENTTVTAQISRGFRDPTLSDRFFRGPNGRGFITGNPALEPETSLQFDLSARYVTSRVRFGGSYYFYEITNLVERYATATDFFEFRNRGRAEIQGVEFEAQADVSRGFSVEFGAQVGRGQATDGAETDLDDISPDTMSFVVRKAVGEKASAFMRLAVYAEDTRPGPSEIDAPGHTNLDLGASWQIHPRLEVRGALRNILDDEYYASPDPRFVLAPGLNGFVSFLVRW